MKVFLSRKGVRSSSFIPSASQVAKIVNGIVRCENVSPQGDIHVILVDNKTIRQINKKFLNENHTTDVIAFPYASEENFGDVYISVPVAKVNAQRYGEKTAIEIIRLIVHGLLHLLGYNDHALADRKKMWARQEYFVQKYQSL